MSDEKRYIVKLDNSPSYWKLNGPPTPDPFSASHFSSEEDARAIAKIHGKNPLSIVKIEEEKPKPKPPKELFWSIGIGLLIVWYVPGFATALVTAPRSSAPRSSAPPTLRWTIDPCGVGLPKTAQALR